MKLEKKHWIIIGVVIAIIAVWYFFLRKKKTESNYTVPKWRPAPPRNPLPVTASKSTGSSINCPSGKYDANGICIPVGGGVASVLPPCERGPNGVTNAPCTEKKADGTINIRT